MCLQKPEQYTVPDQGYELTLSHRQAGYNIAMQYENRVMACQSETPRATVPRPTLLDWLLPPHCVLCGLPTGPACLCSLCRESLTWAGTCCRRCGLPLTAAGDSRCGQCTLHPPPFTETLYPLQYLFPADRLVQAFKFRRQHVAGRILARLMSEWIASRDTAHPDALVPVPLHPLRLFRRSFNQSHELAAHIGKVLGIPVQAAALRRRRHTRAQSGLDRRQRGRNVRGAFHWHGHRPPPRHVALVDDVMTTGTTVIECTRILKQAGARRVDVWVAARAIPPQQR